MVVKIEAVNPIYCKAIGRECYQDIYDILQYDAERWTQGRFAKQKHKMVQSFFDKRTGEFQTGFLPRVISDLTRKGYKVEVDVENYDREAPAVNFHEPELPGITFREDQKALLEKVALSSRGYIKSPTGSGKTILAAGIISMLPLDYVNTLFLCHTIDLLSQTYEEFQKFGFDVIQLTPANKNEQWWKELSEPRNRTRHAVVVSTVQTFLGMDDIIEYMDFFTAIIVDECHHVTNKEGRYTKILEQSLAPIRIGLTATDQVKGKSKMVIEGSLGPMIGELTFEEGIKNGILAAPEIEWIDVPEDDDLIDLKNYQDIYNKCIVNNRSRNRLIINEVSKEILQNRSVLILVKEVDHGKNLVKLADNILNMEIPIYFVWGATDKETRLQAKKALEDKAVKCVIASVIWKEGINIKSLDCVINAAGGRSEIATLQSIGRGARTTATKTRVVIKDFVDHYKYLINHTALRLSVYVKNKWQMRGV